ncbi:PREDICTED: F-box protein At3g22700-like [Camelina sativa]|uniref:F-box protein At3g22700-like n=1 Tax=Camelina sativa TaxID=90675 RepID=A0ABM1RBP7_CAMSA|nr:PREDICTED: F-box protein At3g22700-like [Camelina sativa]
MMYDLPPDLVEEILSRVPATSVKRLRSTCKRWNAIFEDERFTEKHLRKAPKESMVLMLKGFRVCPVSVNLNVAPPSIEFKGALGLKPKDSHFSLEEIDIVDVFHCDGLLLCTTKDYRLVVWNPCLGVTKWIQCKIVYKFISRFTLGYILNNKSWRSYKILRWWSFSSGPKFEIYEFGSDSWRVLNDVVLDCDIQYCGYSSGASSLIGNTYWVATDNKEGYAFVLSFDFTAERFKRLRLPLFQNDIGQVTLSVGREEQLSALNRSYTFSKIEMWVTNKIDIDSELLWSKSFIVDLPRKYSLKVPTTYLIRLRTTCKRWNALFRDRGFTQKHFRKSVAKDSMVLMLKEHRVCPVSLNLNAVTPSIEFKGALCLNGSHSNSGQVDIVRVSHSGGLLLCTTKDDRLVVWNPCLGETRWIPFKDDYKRYGTNFTLGYIQNNESCRRYKILCTSKTRYGRVSGFQILIYKDNVV